MGLKRSARSGLHIARMTVKILQVTGNYQHLVGSGLLKCYPAARTNRNGRRYELTSSQQGQPEPV